MRLLLQLRMLRFEQVKYSSAVKKTLLRRPALFINNEWMASTHDVTLSVIYPSSGGEISQIADASDADFDRAVGCAPGFRRWPLGRPTIGRTRAFGRGSRSIPGRGRRRAMTNYYLTTLPHPAAELHSLSRRPSRGGGWDLA
ncbi:hypothetical protein [Nitrospirillum sp. BR 11163]|uniref:hypothetical protein n=1 Tax=Nitrospirillum sp. BR 11163 TaxID=3104323 RepID=UPI002AFEAA5F|nr:hypothetical protein [Nitrospirillum sp. BR 11163]MEA1672811.1 hypothetical protein [Nitrospirillum sp. BR 11163]